MLSAIFGILFIAFSVREISCDEAHEIGTDFAFLTHFQCPVRRYFVVTKDNGHFVLGCSDDKIELKHCVTYLTENSISYINRSSTFELRDDEKAEDYGEDVVTPYKQCKDAHGRFKDKRAAGNYTMFEDYFQSMKENVLRADWTTFGKRDNVQDEVFYGSKVENDWMCQNVNSTYNTAQKFDSLPKAKKIVLNEAGSEALTVPCDGDNLLFLKDGVSLFACPEKHEESRALYEGCCPGDPAVGEDKMKCYIGNPSKHYNYALTTEDGSGKKFTFDDGAPTPHEQCVMLSGHDPDLKGLNNLTTFEKLLERIITKNEVAGAE